MLQRLQREPGSGIARVLTGDALQTTGGFAAASFVVDLKPGFRTGNAVRGAITRPAIGATLSGPPSAAGGIVVNSIDGVVAALRKAQPLSKKRTGVPNANAKIDRRRELGRDHFMAS